MKALSVQDFYITYWMKQQVLTLLSILMVSSGYISVLQHHILQYWFPSQRLGQKFKAGCRSYYMKFKKQAAEETQRSPGLFKSVVS